MDRRGLADGAREIARLIGESVVTASSRDRLVTVSMAPGNVVTRLELADTAVEWDRARLAAAIVDTVQEAARKLAQDVADRIGEPSGSLRSSGLLAGLAGRPGAGPADPDLPEVELVAEPELPAEWADRGGAGDLAAAARAWDEFTATVERQVAAYNDVRGRVADVDVTVSSPDGAIEVTLQAGELVRLDISRLARYHDSRRLAREITVTLQRAQAELAVRLAEQAQALIGPRLDVHALVGRYQPGGGSADEGRP